jgi:hypothetical protein
MTWQIALLLITPLTLVFAVMRKMDRIEDKLDALIDLIQIDLEFRARQAGDQETMRALRKRTSALNRHNDIPARS